MRIDPEFHYRDARGGGRTTQLMLKAIDLVSAGHNVIFVTATYDDANNCSHRFAGIIDQNPELPRFTRYQDRVWTVAPPLRGVEFLCADSSPRGRINRLPSTHILIDHWAYKAASAEGVSNWIYARRHLNAVRQSQAAGE